nr:MAG TPA: hypothetical protein [Caudoviricetes sp.]
MFSRTVFVFYGNSELVDLGYNTILFCSSAVAI